MKRIHLPILRLSLLQIAWMLLILLMVIYSITMSYEAILRYSTFKATAFDLGNLDQVLWNTLHGRFFVWTNQGDNWFGPPTRLAQHVEPIILPLSLLYTFHADPRILLTFQTLVLAAGAPPVFLLTRKHLPDWPLLAPVMAAVYLISPALLGINIFDFHPVALTTPLLLYAILALSYKRYFWFVIACICAAACKEEIPSVVALFGLLVIWKYKVPRLGLLLFSVGIIWSFIAVAIIVPHFYHGTQHNTFWYRYQALGSSPGVAAVNILLHPWVLITTFVSFDRIYYVANLFRATGFLALFAPEWLLATIPNMAINILSGDQLLYTGVYQYNAPIIPFLMMASIVGLQRIVGLWARWRGETLILPTGGAPGSSSKGIDKEKKRGFLTDRIILAYSSMTQILRVRPVVTRSLALAQTLRVRPVVTRSLALAQPHFSAVAYEGVSQWRRLGERMATLAKSVPLQKLQWVVYGWLIAMALLNFIIMTPTLNVLWATSVPGVREERIEQLLAEIPADASVSAGTSLNPHLTERQYITIFPNITISSIPGNDKTVEYVIVDLSTVFPEDKISTIKALNQLSKGQFCTMKIAENVILLGRRDVASCP